MTEAEPTWLTLLPATVAVVTAVLSRRPIESLLAGVITGLLLLEPAGALEQFSSILLAVMMDETIAWVIIVCGLMGSLIALLMRAGATNAFSEALAVRASSGSSALLYTWLLGLLVFMQQVRNELLNVEVSLCWEELQRQHRYFSFLVLLGMRLVLQ